MVTVEAGATKTVEAVGEIKLTVVADAAAPVTVNALDRVPVELAVLNTTEL